MTSIGMLVIEALLYGGKALADGALKGAAKSIYDALEAKVRGLFGDGAADETIDVESDEIARRVAELDQARREELRRLANELIEALRAGADPRAAAAVEIDTLRAGNIRLGRIDATGATAFRARDVETPGDFSIDQLAAGSDPGKG